MSNVSLRERLKQKNENIDASLKHDGRAITDPQGRDDGRTLKKNFRDYGDDDVKNDRATKMRYGLQGFLWAPYNKGKGEERDLDNRPSFWTYVATCLWILIACTVIGFIYTYVVDRGLGNLTADTFAQGFIFATVLSLISGAFMMVSFSPLLRTQVSFSSIITRIGTRDLGLFPALGFMAVVVLGYMCGGWATQAVGMVSVDFSNATLAEPSILPNPFPHAQANAGHWLYWLGGSLILTFYVFFQKFYNGHDQNSDVNREKRNVRSIVISQVIQFVCVMAFRPNRLFYMDSGIYLSALTAARFANLSGTGVLDWAFYVFVPIASALTALLFYWGVNAAIYSSNYVLNKVGSKYQYDY